MLSKTNKFIDKESRFRSNSKPSKHIHSTRGAYQNHSGHAMGSTSKRTPTHVSVKTGSTRNETPDSIRKFSVNVSPAGSPMSHTFSHRSPNNKAHNVKASPFKSTFNPQEIMNVRWLQAIQNEIPSMDFEDLNISGNPDVAPRQFSPEFSQHAYTAMLSKEIVIGDYIGQRMNRTGFENKFNLTTAQRE